MKQGFVSNHWRDEHGNPDGGCAYGNGFCVSWQRGPMSRDGARLQATGAFIEDVIASVVDRLEHHQQSKFACAENAEAIAHLQQALVALERRTKARADRGVEGTHEK